MNLATWRSLVGKAIRATGEAVHWRSRRRTASSGLALTTCVRNEAAFLPAFLMYHRAVGVERAYVFLDRCTDETRAIATAFPWVRVFVIDPEEAARFEHIPNLQIATMDRALELAREEGFPWLLTLDPDEFAFADNPTERTAIGRGHLGKMLARVPDEAVMVRLPTHESVPSRAPSAGPFWRCPYFQGSPRLTWNLLDPETGRLEQWCEFLGHRQGKSIIRTAAEVQAYDNHRWVPFQASLPPTGPEFVPIPTCEAGLHWHFFVANYDHWLTKSRQQANWPDRWPCGNPVELPKRCWRRASLLLEDRELAAYFDRWVARPEAELESLAQAGLVERSDAVARVLHAAGCVQGDNLRTPSPRRSEADLEVFRPFERPAEKGPRLAYRMDRTPRVGMRSSYPLERAGKDLFRWTEPMASLRIEVPPGDYRVCLDMKGLAGHWSGELRLWLGDREVPPRDPTLDDGVIGRKLRREDFPPGETTWLRLETAPVDSSTWPTPDPRRLGLPLFAIAFVPC